MNQQPSLYYMSTGSQDYYIKYIRIFVVQLGVIPACNVTDSKLTCLSQTHSVLWHVFTVPADYNAQGYHPTLLQFIPRTISQSCFYFYNKYNNFSLQLFLLTVGILAHLWPQVWFWILKCLLIQLIEGVNLTYFLSTYVLK